MRKMHAPGVSGRVFGLVPVRAGMDGGMDVQFLQADLARQGRLIGPHDMIVAATALHHRMALLTANRREFSRVPGLDVIPYRGGSDG